MQYPPKLPDGITWDDVELIPQKNESPLSEFVEIEPTYVARNKKTGEIYE